jgi:hypothetical protein
VQKTVPKWSRQKGLANVKESRLMSRLADLNQFNLISMSADVKESNIISKDNVPCCNNLPPWTFKEREV